MVWVKVAGVVTILIGTMYILAAMGVEALGNLTDSAGGPWVQGLVAIAIGIGLLIYAERKAPKRTSYDHGLTNLPKEEPRDPYA